MERRFTVDTKLKVCNESINETITSSLTFQILLNFATANGFPPDEFKVISSFPRRDVRQMSLTKVADANIWNIYSSRRSIQEKRWSRWNFTLKKRWCLKSDNFSLSFLSSCQNHFRENKYNFWIKWIFLITVETFALLKKYFRIKNIRWERQETVGEIDKIVANTLKRLIDNYAFQTLLSNAWNS